MQVVKYFHRSARRLYLNQCWLIVSWILGIKKTQRNPLNEDYIVPAEGSDFNKTIDQSRKSNYAPVPYAHFCFEWCVVRYGAGGLWDLWTTINNIAFQ